MNTTYIQQRRRYSLSDETLLFSPLDPFCLEVSYPVVVPAVVVIAVDAAAVVSTFFRLLKKFGILFLPQENGKM